ncbi:hypothetical protein P154DRAFT_56631 [Amniculicola lignicola CBS 123094]|uniref:Uncharacterized protein n=1 Tax=Amniculicola lignicola CBS 123094 TaxID=1392246 RepID=A0A6A5X1Q9_9PLEO|nr:hypothetical protein P154DRAFT_56631 [Amniculicola lignicola CBS 123094]
MRRISMDGEHHHPLVKHRNIFLHVLLVHPISYRAPAPSTPHDINRSPFPLRSFLLLTTLLEVQATKIARFPPDVEISNPHSRSKHLAFCAVLSPSFLKTSRKHVDVGTRERLKRWFISTNVGRECLSCCVVLSSSFRKSYREHVDVKAKV